MTDTVLTETLLTTLKDALLGQGAALSTAAQRFGETEFALADAVPAVG